MSASARTAFWEPIRTLVCDDEAGAREGLLALLSGDPQIAVVGEARTGCEATALIEKANPELAGDLSQQLAALLDDAVPIGARSYATDQADVSMPASVGDESSACTPYTGRIAVRSAKQVVFVRVNDIDWIEADDYYSKLHIGGHAYLIRETMGSLEARLDPSRFARVHRSAIVNLDRVQTLQPYFRGAHVLTLRDGTRLTLSRSRRAAFERAVGCRF